eukprot:2618644-Rhodomonas_salina.1
MTLTFTATEATTVPLTPRMPQVRIGKDGTYSAPLSTQSSLPCTVATFGDPLPGVVKECMCCLLYTSDAADDM